MTVSSINYCQTWFTLCSQINGGLDKEGLENTPK